MLKRKILDALAEWKKSANKRALLIEGARQVGKTFAVREFGRANYKNYIEINFEKQIEERSAFDGNLDASTIIRKLSSMHYGPFEKGETLIFLDEIQSCPQARTALKFLVEDGRFDWIASGSLLGISYRQVSSYPVGYETKIQMYPLDFEEFLWAKNSNFDYIGEVYKSYTELVPVDDFLHKKLMELYHEYLVVGGMPAAVWTYINNDDFGKTLQVQKDILKSYRDDIALYADDQKALVKKMFDAIPEQLNKKNKRFFFADLEQGTKAKKYENACMWMTEAGIAYNCYNVGALELALTFNEKRNLYKLYMHDTGLLCAQGFSGIQSALLGGDIAINQGAITENAVAAALAKRGIPLYYFDKKSRMELDFVFAKDNALTVIEVKSGKEYKKHAALDAAPQECQNKTIAQTLRKIVLCKHNVERGENGIIYLPLYMAMLF